MWRDASVDSNTKALATGTSVADDAEQEHAWALTLDNGSARIELAGVLAQSHMIVSAHLIGGYGAIITDTALRIHNGHQLGLLQRVRFGKTKAQSAPASNIDNLVGFRSNAIEISEDC